MSNIFMGFVGGAHFLVYHCAEYMAYLEIKKCIKKLVGNPKEKKPL